MSLAFGFALPHWQAISGGFSPASLFAGGTAGAWYDPSDLSTMFDSSAGTTPVAMPGLGAPVPVGLMLDKSQNGVGTNGAKRVNLLTFSEQFDNAAWTKTNAAAANTTATTDPLGGTTANTLTEDAAANIHRAFQEAALTTANVTVTVSISLKANTRTKAVFGVGDNSDFRFYAAIDLSAGAITQSGVAVAAAGASLVSASISSQGNGWYRVTLTGTVATGQTKYFVNVAISNSDTPGGLPSYLGNGTSGIYIWGADLRLASEANTQPTYQRIDANWYSTMAGNHAIAANDSTKRPVLMARVNLLTYSEEFSNAAWILGNINPFGAGSVANTTATLDPVGGNTADFIQENTSNAVHFCQQLRAITSGVSYSGSFYVKPAGRSWVHIGEAATSNGVYFDIQNGAVGSASAGYVGSIQNAGNGWYQCRVAFASSAGAGGGLFITTAIANGNRSYTGDGTSGIYIWGADLRPANIGANVPAYQRIADANTYDTSGFPLYLLFDGNDDSMYTPANLNLSGTDKVAVFAGVRKLSDAAAGMVTELASFLLNGTFNLAAPSANVALGANFGPAVRGNGATSYGEDAGSNPAPRSAVLTSSYDLAAVDKIDFRINGATASVVNNGGAAGTGNFGAYPLFVGARNNNSVWLNGHLHSLIIAGSAVSASNISATEQWVAGKTGIAIP